MARTLVPILLIISVAAALLPALAATSASPVDVASKEAAVRKLIELTQDPSIAPQLQKSFCTELKATYAGLRQADADAICSRVSPEWLTATLVSIYSKQFSAEEIEQLLAFNQSPIGVKSREIMPTIIQDAFREAQSLKAQMFADAAALSSKKQPK